MRCVVFYGARASSSVCVFLRRAPVVFSTRMYSKAVRDRTPITTTKKRFLISLRFICVIILETGPTYHMIQQSVSYLQV